MHKFFIGLIILTISLTGVVMAASKRALLIDDLLACQRLKDPQFSPDGKWIAFSVETMNEAENKGHKDIWIVRPDGTKLQKFTDHETSSSNPRWSPDGRLAFLSARSGPTQIWIKNVDGGEPVQLTDHYTGVSDFIWSPDGKQIAFVTRVFPDCSDQKCIEERDKAAENSEVKARVYEDLMFRHWDSWWDHKRDHIFVMTVADRRMVDVTPGDYDAPPIALGEGFCFSKDSKQIYFTSNHDAVVATSTNNDIFVVPVGGGEAQLVTKKCEIRDFKGNDSQPRISPEGKTLAFLSMRRAGFEADKASLFLLNLETGKFSSPTANWDRSIADYQWLPDGKDILVRVDEGGRLRIYKLNSKTGDRKALVEQGCSNYISVSPNGKTVAYLNQNYNTPYELFVADLKTGKANQITHFNDDLFAQIEMSRAEDFWFEGAGKTKIHGFIIRPPFFDASKKYPMVFMVHGGPQGAWQDEWHYRWNPQMWAAQGYVLVMINPRGSTGYGQKLTDEISKDWGGKVFQDLIAGQKYVIQNFPFIDSKRLAAVGASYGGYMMNWMEGHMDDFAYPFQTLINHDGSFNLYAEYLTTEELWFPEWENDGPYWEDDEFYRKWSPHQFVKNFKTPMLVIHGEQDMRLDFSEGLMVFTALRRVGVPAKLVLFPDEGHWVLKPQNSRFWHETVFDWLARYLKE